MLLVKGIIKKKKKKLLTYSEKAQAYWLGGFAVRVSFNEEFWAIFTPHTNERQTNVQERISGLGILANVNARCMNLM